MAKKIFHTCYAIGRAFTKEQWHDYLNDEERIKKQVGKYIVNDCDIVLNPEVVHFEIHKVWCYANITWADFGNGWFSFGIDATAYNGGSCCFGVSYIDDECAHLEWKRRSAARSKKECLMAACDLLVSQLISHDTTHPNTKRLIQMIKDYKKELSRPKVVQLELF